MDKIDKHRSVTDQNSNAQVDPTRIKAVGGEDRFENTVSAGRPSSDSSGEQMPGITDSYKRTSDGPVLYECDTPEIISDKDKSVSFYCYRNPSQDRIEDDGDDSDGRRSSCSLSDETSSMSETELSTVGDDTDIQREPGYNPSGSEEDRDGSGEDTNTDRQSNSLDCLEDADASVMDDTFTDLTVDSFNLSLMDSCYVEGECSDVPEISTIEITDTDFSYGDQDWGDSELQNSSKDSDTNRVPPVGAESVNPDEPRSLGDSLNETDNTNQIAEYVLQAGQHKTPPEAVNYETETGELCEHAFPEVDENMAIGADQFQTAAVYQNGVPYSYSAASQFQHQYMLYPPYLPPNIQQCCYPWTTGEGQVDETCQTSQGQYQQMQQAQHQQWMAQQYMYPCCPQYSYPYPYVDPSWQNPSVNYQQTVQSFHQAGQPFNTDGVLTADQYYSGQQTAEQFGPSVSEPCEPEFHAPVETSNPEPQNFQYPCVYVSQAGLITVLLKHDVSVELTVDKTLRIVSHHRQLVIASNNRGSANCLYHPHAKVCHNGTTTEVELSDERKVKMCTENILVAKGDKCYRFDYKDLQKAEADFRDIAKDNSVALLFGSSGYGPSLIPECLELAKNAEFTHNEDGSFRVRINDISIAQSNRGDVTVLCGPKFLKMAPLSSYLRLQTHFIDMAVYKNAKVFVRRGTHSLDSNPTSLRVNNGNLEAAFEDGEDISVVRLPRRAPLNALSRRQRQNAPTSNTRQNKYTWHRH